MAFSGAGTGIQNADDILFNNIAQDNMLQYNSTQQKWTNIDAAGTFALADGGGAENVSTANATGSTTLNLANGNVFFLTMTGNVTVANITGAVNGKACSFTLYLKQDGTGSRTVTWPASVKWAGGTAPTLSTAANSVDAFVLESLDGGTTWYGALVGNNFS